MEHHIKVSSFIFFFVFFYFFCARGFNNLYIPFTTAQLLTLETALYFKNEVDRISNLRCFFSFFPPEIFEKRCKNNFIVYCVNTNCEYPELGIKLHEVLSNWQEKI